MLQKFRRQKQQNSYGIRVMTPPKPPITTSPKLASTHSPRSPGPAPRNSFARPCLREVHQSSASGALKLLRSRHGPVPDQVLGDPGGGGPGLAEQREHAVGRVHEADIHPEKEKHALRDPHIERDIHTE